MIGNGIEFDSVNTILTKDFECVTKYGLDLRDICSGRYTPETGWVADPNTTLMEFREIVESGCLFDVSWNSYKEAYSARVCRFYDDSIVVRVWDGEMDEEEDLVYDATPDGIELTDEEIEWALNVYYEVSEIGFWAERYEIIPVDSTVDEILDKVNDTLSLCCAAIEDAFNLMKNIVQNIIDNRKEN